MAYYTVVLVVFVIAVMAVTIIAITTGAADCGTGIHLVTGG